MKKEIEIASKIASAFLKANSDYIYDPDHHLHPSGGYHKTEKGWSKLEERKDNGNVPSVKNKSNSKNKSTKVQNELDKKMNTPVKNYLDGINEFYEMSDEDKKEYYSPHEIKEIEGIKKALDNFSVNVDGDSVADKLEEADWDLGNGSDVRMYFDDEKVLKSKKCQKVFKEVADKLNSGNRDFNGYGLSQKFMDVAKSVKSDYASLKSYDKEKTQANIETAAYMMGLYSLMPEHNPYISLKTIGYSPKSSESEDKKEVKFYISKLSPEMREKVKDWDAEDIAKFLGWLKEHKGE